MAVRPPSRDAFPLSLLHGARPGSAVGRGRSPVPGGSSSARAHGALPCPLAPPTPPAAYTATSPVASRPPSRLASRPASRLASRPASRLASRPASRLASRPASAADHPRMADGDVQEAHSLQDASDTHSSEWQPYSRDRYVRATIPRAEVEAALEGGDYVIIEEEVLEELSVEEPGQKPNVIRRIRRKVLKNRSHSTLNTSEGSIWETDSLPSESRMDSSAAKTLVKNERLSSRSQRERGEKTNSCMNDFRSNQCGGDSPDNERLEAPVPDSVDFVGKRKCIVSGNEYSSGNRGFSEKQDGLGNVCGREDMSGFGNARRPDYMSGSSSYMSGSGNLEVQSHISEQENKGYPENNVEGIINVGLAMKGKSYNVCGRDDGHSSGNWDTSGSWSCSENINGHRKTRDMEEMDIWERSSMLSGARNNNVEGGSDFGSGRGFHDECYDSTRGFVGSPGGHIGSGPRDEPTMRCPGDVGGQDYAQGRAAQPLVSHPPAPSSSSYEGEDCQAKAGGLERDSLCRADREEDGFVCWERPQMLTEEERPLLPSPPPSPNSGSTESTYRRRFYDPYQLDRHAVWYGDKYKWMTGVPLPAWVMELRLSDEAAFTECMEHFQAYGRWPSDAELGPCPTAIPAAGGGFMHNPAAPLPTFVKLTKDRSTLNQYFTHFKIFGRWPRIA